MKLLALAACALVAVSKPAFAWECPVPHRARGGRLMETACPELKRNETAVSPQTKQTPLDYADPNADTFDQRYWVDTQFWASSAAPIFISVGGEGPCGPPGGWAAQLASSYNAMIASIEHRFYGESLPTGGAATGLTVANLQHLTVANALADLNAGIDHIKSQYGADDNAPVVLIGGSYPGGLVGWHRVAFPDKTVFGLASSGVVNPILEYTAFDEAVAKAIQGTCADTLRATTAAFDAAEAAGAESRSASRALFNSPDSLSTPDFSYMLADSAAMAVQYGTKASLCAALKPSSDPQTLMSQFASFTKAHFGESFGADCFYDTQCLQNDADRWQPTARSWRWQKCKEVAWLQTAPATGSLRSQSLTIEALLQQCTDVFGAGNDSPNVDGLRAAYGGAKPNTTFVFYSQGSDDPWRPAGVMETISATLREFTASCDGCGHCRDLHSPASSDPEVLSHQRQLEVALLGDALRKAGWNNQV